MSGVVEGVALLPCPFCASTETGLYRPTEARECSGWHDWFVRCHQCHVESAEYETEAEAVTAWNTRTTPPARPYADGVEDAAKVADDYAAERKGKADCTRDIVERRIFEAHHFAGKNLGAAIRLLSQGGKA